MLEVFKLTVVREVNTKNSSGSKVSIGFLERYFEYLRLQNKGKFRAEVCTPDEYLIKGRRSIKVKRGVSSQEIADKMFCEYYGFLDEVNTKLASYNCGLKPAVAYSCGNLDVTGVEVRVYLEIEPDLKDLAYKDFLKVKAILEEYVTGAMFWTY